MRRTWSWTPSISLRSRTSGEGTPSPTWTSDSWSMTMEKLGLIQRIGMTPTDIMHARGVFNMYDTEASRLGIACFARRLGITSEEFIGRVDDMICRRISNEIISKVIYEDSGQTELKGL